jgi:membrane protein implicated in regulation of membrane protease activity
MINTLFLWATLIILALLIEMGAPGLFYFLSLAIGSSGAAVLSYLNFDITTQLAGCLVISLLALIVLRYAVSRDSTNALATNTHALIGQKTLVIEQIAPDKPGLVKIYGDTWLAREKNNHDVAIGEEVTIIDIQGCHLIVRRG